MKTVLTMSIILATIISCSKTSDPSANAPTAFASIGGVAFKATDSKITDTGHGLEIIVKGGNQVITLVTGGNAPGIFNIMNINGDGAQSGPVYVTYVNGIDTYLSHDGSATISFDLNGKISATFTVNVKNSAGSTISITEGKIVNLPVGPAKVPIGKCLINRIVNGLITITYAYNNDGNLLKIISQGEVSELYIWANGKVVNHVLVNLSGYSRKYDWFYTKAKLTKVTFTEPDGAHVYHYTTDYTLNPAGQPTKMVSSSEYSNVTFNYIYDSNGNCISADYGSGVIEGYSDYDTKANVTSSFSTALGITFLPDPIYVDFFYSAEAGNTFSKNNVGSISPLVYSWPTRSYTYDSNGNVTSIVDPNNPFPLPTTYSCN